MFLLPSGGPTMHYFCGQPACKTLDTSLVLEREGFHLRSADRMVFGPDRQWAKVPYLQVTTYFRPSRVSWHPGQISSPSYDYHIPLP